MLFYLQIQIMYRCYFIYNYKLWNLVYLRCVIIAIIGKNGVILEEKIHETD